MSEERVDCLPDDVWPIGKKAAFYSCFVVFCLGIFDFIDRQVLAAVLPYIKAEWNVSDTQLGLLVSIVNFVMAALVIPSSYLIDRWSRKKMIAIMGTTWSLATAACAFAGNYVHLLTARAFVGSGEAGYNPAAQALLSAQFPKKYRGFILALSQVGLGLGAPLGLLAGAYIATHWGWRHAFGVVAVPGLILSIMALFIRDYKSVEVTSGSGPKAAAMSYPAVLAGILRTPSLLCVFGGALGAMMYNGAAINWLPSYLQREAGLPLTTASAMSAAVFILPQFSVLIAGAMLDRLHRMTVRGVPLFVACSLFTAVLAFLLAYGVLKPGSGVQITALMAGHFFLGVATSAGPIFTMGLSHPGARGTAAGLLIFSQNLFGFALGPMITGFLSDHFDLGTALLFMTFAPALVAVFYTVCTFTYKRDLDRVECVNLDFGS